MPSGSKPSGSSSNNSSPSCANNAQLLWLFVVIFASVCGLVIGLIFALHHFRLQSTTTTGPVAADSSGFRDIRFSSDYEDVKSKPPWSSENSLYNICVYTFFTWWTQFQHWATDTWSSIDTNGAPVHRAFDPMMRLCCSIPCRMSSLRMWAFSPGLAITCTIAPSRCAPFKMRRLPKRVSTTSMRISMYDFVF